MKRIVLLRHAKSSWKLDHLPDFFRPLKKEGIVELEEVIPIFKSKEIILDKIICSPAHRAYSTAMFAAGWLGNTSKQFQLEELIYSGKPAQWLSILKDVPDTARTVLWVGHNPGISELMEHLCGHSAELLTGSIYCIQIEVKSWKDLKKGTGKLEFSIIPSRHDEKD